MLFLLDIEDRAVFECPLHNVGFRTGSFDVVALLELGPKLVEVL